jgi:predicted Zn-dependent protease with MMP-like domain
VRHDPPTARNRFDRLVQEAYLDVPAYFRRRIKNVAIVVEEEPARDDLHRAGCPRDSTLLGLYTGIPLTNRTSSYGLVLPDRITIFRGPIERMAHGEADLRRIVRHTVWHELGHYFGMNERQVREMERRWMRRRRSDKPGNRGSAT